MIGIGPDALRLDNNALDAGLEEGLNVLDVPDATWERVLAVNLFAAVAALNATAHVLPPSAVFPP